MKKVLKWVGIVFGSLLGLLLVVVLGLYISGNARWNKAYEFPPSNITVPTDADSIALGKHRAEVLCQGCHGTDLSGITKWFDDPMLGSIDTANLTAGAGGIGGTYSTEEFVLAIRHGVGKDGTPLFMPAVESTANLSDEELGSIIAYIRSVPPVDHETHSAQFKPMAKILLAAGVLNLPVEVVSHKTDIPSPTYGANAEYGEYLVNTNDCRLCHGPNLNGGPYPDPTITRISPNLTPGGELAFWSEADFIKAIRDGKTPSGRELDASLMPWDYYGNFYDDELKAIWLYLQSLPKLEQYTE